MCMIIAAWLFGPLFNATRKIPTNCVTPEGICLYRDVFLSQFWNNFETIVTCIVVFFFPLIFILSLYKSIFHFLHEQATKGKLGQGNENQSDLMNKAITNVLKTSIFVTTFLSLLGLEFIFFLPF